MPRTKGGKSALVVVILILLAIFIPPFVNVNRFRGRIAEAMSSAVGRPVTIGSISLRLLPQPGFDLENVVVSDDPAFSAEPVLRADEVAATLRMTSLWRGRLEIARLSLKYPSLNLVFTPEGKLNLESLLWRASRTSAAPTSARRPQGRIRFPYIEATNGRVNFKIGLEKQVFAFTDADFSLWSPWEDEWRMRMEAHPVRTDVNISDTGTLRVDGSFHRAEDLKRIPLNVRWSLQRGQLGQLTKLIYGRDRGWRGTIDVNGTLTGQAGTPNFALTTRVDDFRRYDIMGGDSVRIDAQCSGDYVFAGPSSTGASSCRLPMGTGAVMLEAALRQQKPTELTVAVNINDVPAAAAIGFAKRAKRDLPQDLTAAGKLDGLFKVARHGDASVEFTGNAVASEIALKSALLEKDLAVGNVALVASQPARNRTRRTTSPANVPNELRVELQPFAVALGGTAPAAANGWVSSSGYNLSVTGDSQVARLLQVARALGIGVPHFGMFGGARLNLAVQGQWRGFVQPTATGTATLQNVRAEVPGVAAPVQIASANAVFSQNEVRVQNLSASVDTISLTGAATLPRHCEVDVPCIIRFDVRTPEIDSTKLNQLLNPRLKKRPWYRFFGVSDERSALAMVSASGHVAAGRVILGPVTATNFNSNIEFQNGKLRLANIQADYVGGRYAGDLVADFTGNTPQFSSEGTVTRASLALLSAAQKESWGAGTLSASYTLKASGSTEQELMKSLSGSGTLDVADATFRHISLEAKAQPLRVRRYTVPFTLADGNLRLEQSKLDAISGIYQVSGTASLNRAIELQFMRADGAAYKLTGTLEKPQVAVAPIVPASEAALKQ